MLPWAGLAVLSLPCLLVSLDAEVLNLAAPQLSRDLHPTSTQLLWIMDSYVFVVAGGLIAAGVLGDRVGRRRLLLAGAAGFGAASVLAAFATSPGLLIAARVLMGLAGASLRPLPPGASKHKDVRYFDIHENVELDDAQMASWLKQAAALPGWIP